MGTKQEADSIFPVKRTIDDHIDDFEATNVFLKENNGRS